MRDKKRFAWALLSILKNNIVTAPLYYFLLTIQYVELLALYLLFAFIFYNEQNSKGSVDPDSFMGMVDDKVTATLMYISTDILFQVVVICIVLIFDATIILTLLYLASQFESPEKAKRSSIKSKILSFLI